MTNNAVIQWLRTSLQTMLKRKSSLRVSDNDEEIFFLLNGYIHLYLMTNNAVMQWLRTSLQTMLKRKSSLRVSDNDEEIFFLLNGYIHLYLMTNNAVILFSKMITHIYA